MTTNEKIREIISYYKLSDRQFAIRIGVNQSVIGSMFQKSTEPSAKVIRLTLAAFPEISAEWFLRDSGNMLIGNKEAEKITKLVDTINLLQDTINEKNQIISSLSEQLQQLKNQLNK